MRHLGRRYLLIVAALIVVLGGVAGGVAASGAGPDWLRFWDSKYEFNGGFYEPPREAFEFEGATDQHGNPFTLAEYKGKVVFMYFGYTNCPDACPATLAEWREVKAALGDKADDVVFAFVTVDPNRDSPDVMKQYIDFWDPSFLGVHMSEADTKAITQKWGIQYNYTDQGSASGYLVNHDTATYVVDPDSMLRLTYPLGFSTDEITEDVNHLIDGD